MKKILTVFLILILAVSAFIFGFVHNKFNLMKETENILEMNQDKDYEEVVSANKDDIQFMDELASTLEETEVILSDKDISKDSNVFNILLIGTDERTGSYSENARGDTCMLLSINTSTDIPVLSLVSFERGMGVPILSGQYEGQYDWLTHTFRYGGTELLLEEIRECFKVDVEYYLRVNFNAFVTAIDAVGGVDVELDQAEVQYFIDGFKYKEAKVGTNHLNGEMALNYARLREIDSDWIRIQRQREVIFSALNQVAHMSLSEINYAVDEVLPLVKTNLTELKVAELFLLLPKLTSLEMQQMTIPQKGTYGIMTGMGNRNMLAVDFEINAQILQDFLYSEENKE